MKTEWRIAFLLFLGAFAPAAEFKAGVYRQSQGYVEVKKLEKETFSFELSTVSLMAPSLFPPRSEETEAMPRFCEISGQATYQGAEAVYREMSDDKKNTCVLTMKLNDNVLDVSDSDCDFLCSNTSPAGLFRFDDGSCAEKKLRAERKKFQEEYAGKKYQAAKETMEGMLSRCRIELSNPDTCWLQNDLALTKYKMGDLKGCLADLKEIRERMGIEGKLEKAVVTNERLCRGPAK
jgi:hypothetical protein